MFIKKCYKPFLQDVVTSKGCFYEADGSILYHLLIFNQLYHKAKSKSQLTVLWWLKRLSKLNKKAYIREKFLESKLIHKKENVIYSIINEWNITSDKIRDSGNISTLKKLLSEKSQNNILGCKKRDCYICRKDSNVNYIAYSEK